MDSETSFLCVSRSSFETAAHRKRYLSFHHLVPQLSVNQGSAVSGAQQELGHQNDPNIQSVLAQGFAQTQAYGSNTVQGGHPVDLNEDGIIDDYERAYARGEAEKGNMSSESMGTAAAMSVSQL